MFAKPNGPNGPKEEILVYGASDISVSLEAGVLVTFSIAFPQ